MPTTPESPAPVTIRPPAQEEVRIYSHSSLFYWWPVWAVGLLMGLLTLFDKHKMAVVPEGTSSEAGRQVESYKESRDVLVFPKDKRIPRDNNDRPVEPRLHMATRAEYGV